MAGYETYSEMAADLDMTEEELQRLLLRRCPRRIDDSRELIDCTQCDQCGPLPF